MHFGCRFIPDNCECKCKNKYKEPLGEPERGVHCHIGRFRHTVIFARPSTQPKRCGEIRTVGQNDSCDDSGNDPVSSCGLNILNIHGPCDTPRGTLFQYHQSFSLPSWFLPFTRFFHLNYAFSLLFLFTTEFLHRTSKISTIR